MRREKRSRQTSGRLRPVAIPSLAESVWISIAIRFEATITQQSASPNFEPAAMFVAKFPGSTYATHAMKAGPRNGQKRSERFRGNLRSASSAGACVLTPTTASDRVAITRSV